MSKAELIARGHAILDEAPRDYSAVTNLVVDALAEGWGKGFEAAGDSAYVSAYGIATVDWESPNPYRKKETS